MDVMRSFVRPLSSRHAVHWATRTIMCEEEGKREAHARTASRLDFWSTEREPLPRNNRAPNRHRHRLHCLLYAMYF